MEKYFILANICNKYAILSSHSTKSSFETCRNNFIIPYESTLSINSST